MTRPLLLSTALLVLAGSASAQAMKPMPNWDSPGHDDDFWATCRTVTCGGPSTPPVWVDRSSVLDEWAYCEAHPCVSIYEVRRHLFADASKTITKLIWECDPSDGEPVVGEAAHAGSLEIDAPTREQMGQRYVCVSGGEGLPVLYGDLAKSLAEPKP